MDIQENFVNRVAESGLMTIDLEEFYHTGERVMYDLKDNLFHGLMLREKDLRDFVKEHDWTQYTGKLVAIHCSADAIVPTWAYMLIANRMAPYAAEVVFGDLSTLESVLWNRSISKLDLAQYQDQRVVVKGCADFDVPVAAYVEITRYLSPVVKSLMYGEPCSTVPIFKRKA
ncbi:MAG: DUF2480 family protein [Pedobacter sp.]|nr:MAG: DUF2480 family protein [Pedobacter sp.]